MLYSDVWTPGRESPKTRIQITPAELKRPRISAGPFQLMGC
jgi:hypothetical protein